MSDLRITKGNTFRTILEVKAYRYDNTEIKDFDLTNCIDMRIKCRIDGVIRDITQFRVIGPNQIEILWEKGKPGAYTIEMTGKYKQLNWRYYSKNPIFKIVDTTEDLNIPEDAILKNGTYYIQGSRIYLLASNPSEIKIDKTTGHWIVGGEDTGFTARGEKGEKGDKGDPGEGVGDYTQLKNLPNLARVALTGDYSDLDNRPTIPTIPTRISQLINDAGFVTTSGVSNSYYNKTQVDMIFNALENRMPKDYSKLYFTIESIDDDNTITWRAFGGRGIKTISVSMDGGITWTAYESSTWGTVLATLNAGDKILIKGLNSRYSSTSHYSYFSIAHKVNVYGNIMSLLYGDSFIDKTELPAGSTFMSFFQQCKIVSAKNLILPATTMKDSCYRKMFFLNINLVEAPELPATTLAESCYNGMFSGCTALQIAPELPAKTLQKWSYSTMFNNCSSLNYIKCLATDTGDRGTSNWVAGVSNTGTFVKDSSMENWTIGDNGIPTGWTTFTDYEYDFVRRYELATKQDVLVSGQNIATINGVSLLNGGNITVTADTSFSQVPVDWNLTDSTAVDYIRNKPVNLTDFTNDLKSFTRSYFWSELDTLTSPGVYIVKYNQFDGFAADASEDSKHIICVGSTESVTVVNDFVFMTFVTQTDVTANRFRTKRSYSGDLYTEMQSLFDPQTNVETTTVKYNGNWITIEAYQSMMDNLTAWSEWQNLIPDVNNLVTTSQLSRVATTGDWNDLIVKPEIFDGDYYSLTRLPNLALKADKSELKNVAFSGSYLDLSDVPQGTGPIPTKVSDLDNDVPYLTSADLSDYYDIEGTNSAIANAISARLTDYATISYITSILSGYTQQIGAINNTLSQKADKSELSNKADKSELNAKANDADLKAVAKDGSYTSLINLPILNTTDVDGEEPNAAELIKNTIKLHRIAKTGSWNDLQDKEDVLTVTNLMERGANFPFEVHENPNGLYGGYNFLTKHGDDNAGDSIDVVVHENDNRSSYPDMGICQMYEIISEYNTINVTYGVDQQVGILVNSYANYRYTITFTTASASNPVMFRMWSSRYPLFTLHVVPLTNDPGFTYNAVS